MKRVVIPPEGHPSHCSLCAVRWADPEKREKVRKRLVAASIDKVATENSELLRKLAEV